MLLQKLCDMSSNRSFESFDVYMNGVILCKKDTVSPSKSKFILLLHLGFFSSAVLMRANEISNVP